MYWFLFFIFVNQYYVTSRESLSLSRLLLSNVLNVMQNTATIQIYDQSHNVPLRNAFRIHNYRPQTKLREGNVFYTCLSVYRGLPSRGFYLHEGRGSAFWGRAFIFLRGVCLPNRVCLPGGSASWRVLHQARPPEIRSTVWRYASYWNAFLLPHGSKRIAIFWAGVIFWYPTIFQGCTQMVWKMVCTF